VIKRGIWEYMRFMYFTNWIWTQTEPSDSKHNIHFLWIEGHYPITKYFSFGAGLGTYWRSSFYENYDVIHRSHPVFRIFFKTAIIDL
ncbi:MAG: hypothetical protein R3321_12785, partial [Nitrososphaeraceae archaeon]|nr:hypothetical protein [Nitrososphaeraceae archaeon]